MIGGIYWDSSSPLDPSLKVMMNWASCRPSMVDSYFLFFGENVPPAFGVQSSYNF